MSKETRDKLRAMPLAELREKRDGFRLVLEEISEFGCLRSPSEYLDEYDDIVSILMIREMDEEEIDL